MATSIELVISNDDKNVRLFLNKQDQIFVEEISDDPIASFWMTINRADWDAMKSFVNKQFGIQPE